MQETVPGKQCLADMKAGTDNGPAGTPQSLSLLGPHMKHEIATVITISASPERVWAVLLDFARYPEWNPFVRSIEGAPSEGSSLKVTIAPPGGKAMTFRPIVLRHSVAREFRWKGKFLFAGLFDGEHHFSLSAVPGGATQFTHGENFSGLLVPLMRGALEGGTRAGFEAMNLALKQRVEARGA
jgi:hypothetical protein